jgi:hypothetical protein
LDAAYDGRQVVGIDLHRRRPGPAARTVPGSLTAKTTLVVLARAILAVIAAPERARPVRDQILIPPITPEIRRLFAN